MQKLRQAGGIAASAPQSTSPEKLESFEFVSFRDVVPGVRGQLEYVLRGDEERAITRQESGLTLSLAAPLPFDRLSAQRARRTSPMRKVIGWICYIFGAVGAVLALQLFIRCELLSAFDKIENLRLDLQEFLYVSSGHHRAYPNGYWVHMMRDTFILGWSLLVIRIGRQQFEYKEETRAKKSSMITCPDCGKKTYPDAYCRFCGFNLVTQQASPERPLAWPVWKVSLIAYSGISLFLLFCNICLIE